MNKLRSSFVVLMLLVVVSCSKDNSLENSLPSKMLSSKSMNNVNEQIPNLDVFQRAMSNVNLAKGGMSDAKILKDKYLNNIDSVTVISYDDNTKGMGYYKDGRQLSFSFECKQIGYLRDKDGKIVPQKKEVKQKKVVGHYTII